MLVDVKVFEVKVSEEKMKCITKPPGHVIGGRRYHAMLSSGHHVSLIIL